MVGEIQLKYKLISRLFFLWPQGPALGVGSGLCVLVSHQEGEGGRNMVGFVETQHILKYVGFLSLSPFLFHLLN